MLADDTRQRIKNIVAGKVIERQNDYCTTIQNILCTSFTASRALKKDFESKQHVKEEQAIFLQHYSKHQDLLINAPDANRQIAKGGGGPDLFCLKLCTCTKQNHIISNPFYL